MDRSISFVADHFCVSHIPAATIPGSRLSNILAQMEQGHSLTRLALDFLQQQDLPGLYRLACGEITHEAYIAGLDAEQLGRNQAAKAAQQAKESERQALEAHYLARETKYRVPNAAPKMDGEAGRNLRRKHEREASEAVLKAQRARQAEWKAQRERNCELAALAYQARASSSNYTAPTAHDIARYFHLKHIAAAVCPPTSAILEALYRGRPLTADEFNHLKHNVPDDLYRLAFGALTLDAYIGAATAVEAEATARKTREEAIEAARIARESDPEYIAMMQSQALYGKYEVSLNDQSLMPRMTNLLQQIDAGNRLPKGQLAWLSTKAKKHFTQRVREAYHRLEADFHADQYRSTGSMELILDGPSMRVGCPSRSSPTSPRGTTVAGSCHRQRTFNQSGIGCEAFGGQEAADATSAAETARQLRPLVPAASSLGAIAPTLASVQRPEPGERETIRPYTGR